MALWSRIKYILLFVILSSCVTFAQISDTTTYTLKWKGKTSVIINGVQKEVLSFRNASHTSSSNFLPYFSTPIKGIYVSDASILNAEWEEINAEESKYLLDPNSIPNETKVEINNGTERKQPVASLGLVTLRRNISNGKFEKLIKFRFKITTGIIPSSPNQSSQFRLSSASGSNSVLSQGSWYKLGFSKTGIYKIDYNYLVSMGLDPSLINPNNIQIWGNGGGMLPELCSVPRPTDLSETSTFKVGAENNVFDKEDYILFYVQGPNIWTKNAQEPFYRPLNHLYSTSSFYFLTIGSSPGKQIVRQSQSGTPVQQFNTYNRREVHEVDLINFLSSGRRWYGEDFIDITTRTFNFKSTGLIGSGKTYLQSSLMSKSTDPSNANSTFTGTINNVLVNSWGIGGSGTGTYIPIGADYDTMDSIPSTKLAGVTDLNLTYSFQKYPSGKSNGYLNYFALNFEENLSFYTNPMPFRNVASLNFANSWVLYNISKNPNDTLRVWDVTDLNNVTELNVQSISSLATFAVQSSAVNINEFIAFTGAAFGTPESSVKIDNQNIHGSTVPNLLIVTNPLFKEQAERLANFRRTYDSLSVLVVTTEEVYNEFSSGAQDLVAIRDCARMFYNLDMQNFNYMLLFGGASYDYRNLNNSAIPTSFVPIYESDYSMDPIQSYSSDDYVGLLDDNEGIWNVNANMDIGVGRLPVKSAQEAEDVVNKLIKYSSDVSNLGNWRQELTYIGDDGELDADINSFLSYCEEISSTITYSQPNYNIDKIYVAANPKEVNAGNLRSPVTKSQIYNKINDGCFIFNYVGHGAETQLASEDIFDVSDIQSLTNSKYPFIVTATCDFGRYDSPSIISGGETFLIHPNGGAIGLLTTTRPVYEYSNEIINNAFHDNVFVKSYRIGDVLRLTKNESNNGIGANQVINRNFALLGDPSMRLAYPKYQVALTKINGKDLLLLSDTLKAQAKVTMSGEVRDNNGNKITNFNGVVYIKTFDKSIQLNTIENPTIQFSLQNKKIFDGSATVKNGDFTFTFIVTKDIDYSVGLGKISLYANVEDGRLTDAGGSFSSIYVGSSEKNVPPDNTPPQAKVYMNDESFVQGGITNTTPLLIAKLFDDNGISVVGGVGSSITATINGDTKNQIVLDSYYKSDRDSYQSGTINYRMSNQKIGFNSLKIDAYDSNKNGLPKGDGIVEYNVLDGGSLVLDKILNYPNPFTTSTMFHFDHNRAGDDLEVLLQVFTVTGKLVKTITAYEASSKTHVSGIHWDGKDDFGDNIGRGVYVYKLSVKALSDGAKKDEYQKLVILN